MKILKNLCEMFNIKNRCLEYFKKIYGNSGVQFIYRTKFGFDIFVHPEKILDIIRTNQVCDAESWMHALQNEIKNSDVAVDVGANIGVTSCWLSKFSRTVYAFEPASENIHNLYANLNLNKIKNVQVVPCAVGENTGEIDFYLRQSFGHHGASRKHITKTTDSVRLPVVRLDEFLQKKGVASISLLKIDVEGSEIDVLKGVECYIQSQLISIIVFEHAPILFENKDQRFEVFDYLSKFNYRIFDIFHKNIERNEMLNLKQGDYYAKPA